MKKLLTLLVGMVLIFGFTGNAGALSFTHTDTVNLDITLADGSWMERHAWTHNTGDFGTPEFTMDSAMLTINASYVSPNWLGDLVIVECQFVGTLEVGKAEWDWTSSTKINITDIFGTWEQGENLQVSILAIEYPGINSLTLNSSALVLNYNDDNDNNSLPNSLPVPEPGTLFLLSTGVVCIATLRRKKTSV